MNGRSFSRASMVVFAVFFALVSGSCSRVPGSSRQAIQAQRDTAFFLFDAFRSSALSQGMRHPDVFGVVYAIAPAILAPGGLRDAWTGWSKISDHLEALASAFSPGGPGERPGRIPVLDGSPEDDALCALWYAGLGDWDKKISAYLGLPERLRGLRLSYNAQDGYGHIRAGCEYLHAQLTEAGVPHEFAVTNSPGHGLTLSLIVEDLLPYMGKNLSSAE